MADKEFFINFKEFIGAETSAQLAEFIRQSAHAGVWCYDFAYERFWGDNLAGRLMGVGDNTYPQASPLEVLGVIHPNDRPVVKAWWQNVGASASPEELHFRVRYPDYRVAYLCTRSQLIFDRDKRPAFLVGLIWDETSTQRREREHKAIVAISDALRELGTEKEVVERAFEEIRHVLETPHALIATREEGIEQRVRVVHACGRWKELLHQDSTYDEGIIGYVLKTREPYRSTAAAEDPRCLRPEVVTGLSGFVAVPLVSKDDVIGVLALGRDERYDDNDLEIAKALASVLATAIARIRHERSLERRVRELSILHDIDLAISNTLDLSFVLGEVLTQVQRHLGVDAVAVHLIDRAANTVQCKAARGFISNHIWDSHPPVGKGLLGNVALQRAPVLIQGAEEIRKRCLRHRMLDEEHFVVYAGFPLIVRGDVAGVMELFHRTPLKVSCEWVNFAECVAGQVAVAVANADLYTNLERTHGELLAAYEATIEGWARAQELRDVYTERHCLRVTERFMELAQHVGYEGESLVIMRRGALLHDIGKIAVPDAILKKPGPLTDEEWQIMREHPRLALEMLRPIKFLERSLDIPAYHHERWDGNGYPFRLKGEEIPHAARLFAVVDVFDALTSERPYRAAWSEEEAKNYLAAQAGSQFDPQVVKAFLNLLH